MFFLFLTLISCDYQVSIPTVLSSKSFIPRQLHWIDLSLVSQVLYNYISSITSIISSQYQPFTSNMFNNFDLGNHLLSGFRLAANVAALHLSFQTMPCLSKSVENCRSYDHLKTASWNVSFLCLSSTSFGNCSFIFFKWF